MSKQEYELKLNSKIDIVSEVAEYKKASETNRSLLKLKISGKHISTSIVNAIRRVAGFNLPCYAFAKESINITKNTSIAINNDMLKLYLGFIPVLGVDPKIYYLADKYWKNVNFSDPNRSINPNEKSYDVYINVKNDTADYMEITTEHLKILLDGKQIKPHNKDYPMGIITLKPKEELICNMKATLGIGELNARWMLSTNTWLTKEIKNLDLTKENVDNIVKIRESRHEDDKIDKIFTITFRSGGQTDEYNIASRACRYLLKKLDMIEKEIKNMFEKKEYQFDGKEYKITLLNEDDTIGHLLIYELQNNSNIINCGYMRDIMLKTIILRIFADTHKKVIKGIEESVIKCSEKLSHLGATINKLREKKFKNDDNSDTDIMSESEDSEISSSNSEE